MAAAMFESLLMNHPFIDGNKRVAFFATDVFLRLNGWKLEVDPDDAHTFIIGLLERGECDFERLLPWVRKHRLGCRIVSKERHQRGACAPEPDLYGTKHLA